MPKSRTIAPRTVEPARPTMRADALTAAARRLSGRPDITKISRSAGRGWQHEAWLFYDTIGEYRYGVDWKASMLSRATLYLARDDERVVDDDSMASAYLAAFYGGEQVVGQMLREVVHIGLVEFQRQKVRIGEVAVVVRLFLGAHGARLALAGIEQARFLIDCSAILENADLAAGLDLDGLTDEAD